MSRYPTYHSEAMVQQRVCDYLRMRYPHVIFRSDYASGLKMSAAQASQHKRLQSSRAFPDLMILEPSHVLYGDYHGLFIELKRADVKIYKKDGSLRSDVHIEEQAMMLDALKERGYEAKFACGTNEATRIIDEYLGGVAIPEDSVF